MKIKLLNVMGSDVDIVNIARVSTGTSYSERSSGSEAVTEISDKDISLIQYLARGLTSSEYESTISNPTATNMLKLKQSPTHFSPFTHPQLTFEYEVPIAIRTQMFKHKVGFTDNEVSRRYINHKPDFYNINIFRKKSPSIKQGSVEAYDKSLASYAEAYNKKMAEIISFYDELIANDVCPEQARFVLPQGCYTKFIRTGSLYAFANFINLRLHHTAQKEIQDVAMETLIQIDKTGLFKHSLQALIYDYYKINQSI